MSVQSDKRLATNLDQFVCDDYVVVVSLRFTELRLCFVSATWECRGWPAARLFSNFQKVRIKTDIQFINLANSIILGVTLSPFQFVCSMFLTNLFIFEHALDFGTVLS